MKRYPFIYITSFFIIGIICTRFDLIEMPMLLALAFSLLAISIIFRVHNKVVFTVLPLLFVLIGMITTISYQLPFSNDFTKLSYYKRRHIKAVQGVVISDVRHKPFFKTQKSIFTLEIKQIKIFNTFKNSRGRVLVNVFKPVDIHYGDLVVLEGKLHRPFVKEGQEAFNYRDFLKIQGISYIYSLKKTAKVNVLSHKNANSVRQISLDLRNKFKKIFEYHLTENEAGIIKAIILGDRTRVPNHVKELFLRTGTAHVLAISGLHIGAVSLLLLMALRFLPISKVMVNILTLMLLLVYLFLTGGRPSVLRATIMIGILLMGEIVEKKSNSLNNLALAAFIIILANPLNIYHIGFQLSFACVGSIFLITPHFKKFTKLDKRRRGLHWMVDALVFSTTIWIGVAGLILYYFQIITPVSILANLVVIPMISLIVFLGFGLMISGIILPLIAPMIAISLKICLNLLVVSIFLFDRLPYTYFYVSDLSGWYIICYYILLVLGLFIISKINPLTSFHRKNMEKEHISQFWT